MRIKYFDRRIAQDFAPIGLHPCGMLFALDGNKSPPRAGRGAKNDLSSFDCDLREFALKAKLRSASPDAEARCNVRRWAQDHYASLVQLGDSEP
jgi:hypothetical protein